MHGLLSNLTYNKKSSVTERCVCSLVICMQVTSHYNEQLYDNRRNSRLHAMALDFTQ